MSNDRSDWLGRIKAVEREYSAVRLAADRLLAQARDDANLLRGEATLRDLVNASQRLDGTYSIRLFAEFETGLRLFWTSARGADPPSRARDLLDGIAATRRIPYDQLQGAHAVREYRNSLLHEREEQAEPIPVAVARGNLCRYFSFLPLSW
jgi:hypothetical protein